MGRFVYRLPVRFHDVDAAGIVFFARYFQYAHDAFEVWMHSLGFPLEGRIAQGGTLLPLAHAEADFHISLRPGQTVSIELEPVEMGPRSFTLRARLLSDGGELHAEVTTIHVCIDVATGRSRPLPEDLRSAVAAHLSSSAAEGEAGG